MWLLLLEATATSELQEFEPPQTYFVAASKRGSDESPRRFGDAAVRGLVIATVFLLQCCQKPRMKSCLF